MGIHKLTGFIDKHFTGWQRKELRGRLVIDGFNIRFHLNKCDWSHGGQFMEYRENIVNFYEGLKRSGVVPIVVLDGMDYTGQKWPTIIRRERDRIRQLHKELNRSDRRADIHSQGIFPALSSEVYVQALVDLGVEYVFVDGEADDAQVEIANYYSCPVLSNDSDMYIYNVEGGVVRLDRMTVRNNRVTAEVYHYQAFCEQFQFQDPSVRLLVPALVGNDFWMSNVENGDFQLLLEEELGPPNFDNHNIFQSVEFASLFDSLESFIGEIPNFPYLDGRLRIKLKRNCQQSAEIYNSHKRYRISDIIDSTELRTSEGDPIPLWALRNYRSGQLSKLSACVLVLKKYALHTFVDDTTRESSVIASLPIRRCVYGILGSDCVMEHYRVEQQLSGEEILSYESVEGCSLPSLRDMPKLSASKRETILYTILGCDKDVFRALDGHWKLVLASTVFWCKTASPPPHLVKSLLICFLICSGHSAPLRRRFTATKAFRNGPEWMPNLHWFAQWQSCYKDAISLDTVLMLPLTVTCPSQLYDGRLVMYFAMPRDLKDLMHYLHVDIYLFWKLLGVVLPEVVAKEWSRHSSRPYQAQLSYGYHGRSAEQQRGRSAQDKDWRSTEQDHAVIWHRRSEKILQHSESSLLERIQQSAVRPTSGGKMQSQKYTSSGLSDKCDSQGHRQIACDVTEKAPAVIEGKPGMSRGSSSKSTSQDGGCKPVPTCKEKFTKPSSSQSKGCQSNPHSIPVEPIPGLGDSEKRSLPLHGSTQKQEIESTYKSKLASTSAKPKPNASDQSQAKLKEGERSKSKPVSNPVRQGSNPVRQGTGGKPTSRKHRLPSSGKEHKPTQAQQGIGTSHGASLAPGHSEGRSSSHTAGTMESGTTKSCSGHRRRRHRPSASAPVF